MAAFTQDGTDPTLRPQVQPITYQMPPLPGTPGATGATTGAPASGPAWTSDPQYAGMDPALQAIYTNSGLTPAGRGTGFADWQYWQGVGPSQYGRLTADIAGTGTDQPTGTPGTGAWMNSGRNRPGAPAAAGAAFGASANLSPFEVQAFQTPGYNPSGIMAGAPGGADASGLYKFLLGRATGQITDTSMPNLNVSPNDPIIKAQTDAYGAQAERGARNAQSAAAATGGEFANPEAVARSTEEQAGQATGAFQASAMVNELGARRQEIAQALTGAQGTLTAEQAMALQEEAQQIDTQLQAWQAKTGMGLNESQFERQLAQNAFQFDTTNYNNTFGA